MAPKPVHVKETRFLICSRTGDMHPNICYRINTSNSNVPHDAKRFTSIRRGATSVHVQPTANAASVRVAGM